MTVTHTLGKKERLCSKLLVDKLFSGKANSMSAWPVRAVFLLSEKAPLDKASVEVLVSVSKRYFKRAVKRNRVKRQIREAYRTNKAMLAEVMAQHPGEKLLVAFIWQDAHLHSSAKVDAKMVNLLQRMAERLAVEKEES